MPEPTGRGERSLPGRPRAKGVGLALLALGLGAAALGATLFADDFGAGARRPAPPPSTLQSLDRRESGGTWVVRGVLHGDERLRLLQNGIRCYQFDSRSW